MSIIHQKSLLLISNSLRDSLLFIFLELLNIDWDEMKPYHVVLIVEKKIQFRGLQIFAQDLNWRRFTVWTSWTWCHWVFKNWNNIEECQHFTLNRWVAIVWKTFHKKKLTSVSFFLVIIIIIIIFSCHSINWNWNLNC